MPAILEPGSVEMKNWLDPTLRTWSKDLQSALRPYEGELECYPVPREVGKVGNDSPDFIIPINSKENKNNIANFFANAKKQSGKAPAEVKPKKEEEEPPKSQPAAGQGTHEKQESIKRERSPEKTSPEKNGDESKRRKLESNMSSPSKSPSAKKTDSSSQKITSFFKK